MVFKLKMQCLEIYETLQVIWYQYVEDPNFQVTLRLSHALLRGQERSISSIYLSAIISIFIISKT